MTRLALFGAGGKMGMRLGRNLKSSAYEVAAVELSSEGQRRIESELGWKGVDDSITLTAPDANVALTGPVPDFEVGGRYLVTAAGSNINSCGYTLDFDEETAADWAGAFAG